MLTRYERTRVISARALQLTLGAAPLIETDEKDPYRIARLEFEKGVLPFVVIREYPDGRVEKVGIYG